MLRCAELALACLLLVIALPAIARAEKITMEQMKAVGRAQDFAPGSRLAPPAPDRKVLTSWIFLPSLAETDERALCALKRFSEGVKGEVRIFLLRGFRGPPKAVKTPCFSAIGATPAWQGALQLLGAGASESAVVVSYAGRRSRQPLQLWKNAIREVDTPGTPSR